MKVIVYHGNDETFFEEIVTAAKSVSKCLVVQIEPGPGTLIQGAFEHKPHIIIMDVSNSELLTEEVRLLKSVHDFRPVLIAGYCKDELEVKESSKLLPSGVHLFHMKDTDSETFLRDCFRIAFNAEYPEAKFAKAKNLEIQMKLGFISNLVSVSSKDFDLETDLNLTDEVTLQLPMNGDSGDLKIAVVKGFEGAGIGPYMNTYRIPWPFPGPWDDVTENTISQDTVDTWLDFRKDSFDSRNDHLAVFTEDETLVRDIIKAEPKTWYQIFRSRKESLSRLTITHPGVIFYDIQQSEGPDLTHIAEMVRIIRDQWPKPLVVIMGSKSDSAALRKLFDYEFILSFAGKLTFSMLQMMEQKFLEKASRSERRHYLKVSDRDRIIRINREIILTSLTEREMTFLLEEDITYFTVAETNLPIPMFLTIVPAEGQLPASRKGRHYKALIHGLSEENLTKIRKIVNQLIYNPVQSFSPESVEIMLKQDYLPKNQKIQKTEEIVPEFETASTGPERFISLRQFRGTSKI